MWWFVGLVILVHSPWIISICQACMKQREGLE